MILYTNALDYRCDGNWAKDKKCNVQPQANMSCDDASQITGYPLPVFLTSDNNVYALDDQTGQDDTGSIACSYTTKDIIVSEGSELQYFRPVEISVNCSNERLPGIENTLTAEYSIDHGLTWTTFAQSPITLTEEWRQHKLEFEDCTTRQVRLRFSDESAGDVQISEITLSYQPSTIRD